MWKEYGVSVYGEKDFSKIEEYLKKAKKYGAKKVFTSAHLPEQDFQSQIQFIQKLANFVHSEGLELIVDFGGQSLFHLFDQKVSDLKIDYIRLDCGYEPSIMEKIDEIMGIQGFIWNASTIDKKTIKTYLSIKEKHPEYAIFACHNFYPRKETALDEDFFLAQNELFQKEGIEVYSFVPNLISPRKPLFEGLPTLEIHRNQSFEEAALYFTSAQKADGIIISDLDLEDEQFKFLNQLINERIIDLKIKVKEGISQKEKAILFNQAHAIRYDSNQYILRSESSRVMAEFASAIEVFNPSFRYKNSITIDNHLYGRYSGELQFVLKDLKEDERVNVVAEVLKEEAYKLQYYKEGFKYRLIKVTSND